MISPDQRPFQNGSIRKISSYQEICARHIKAFDGYIARYMGDGILVYFGYPKAHEDDPGRAVHAALKIIEGIKGMSVQHDVELRVRLGIATGHVVAGDIIGEGASEERAVLGVTPNLAARLQGLADYNSAVISDGTHSLTKGFFEFEDLGRHPLKGISEPEQAWRVIALSSAASRFEASSASGLTPLVGRDEEIALLANRWNQALDNEGQVVILSGEAGVGKTALADDPRFQYDLAEAESLEAHGRSVSIRLNK